MDDAKLMSLQTPHGDATSETPLIRQIAGVRSTIEYSVQVKGFREELQTIQVKVPHPLSGLETWGNVYFLNGEPGPQLKSSFKQLLDEAHAGKLTEHELLNSLQSQLALQPSLRWTTCLDAAPCIDSTIPPMTLVVPDFGDYVNAAKTIQPHYICRRLGEAGAEECETVLEDGLTILRVNLLKARKELGWQIIQSESLCAREPSYDSDVTGRKRAHDALMRCMLLIMSRFWLEGLEAACGTLNTLAGKIATPQKVKPNQEWVQRRDDSLLVSQPVVLGGSEVD